MRLTKYLFALWAGVLIYALLTVFMGAKGVSAYKQLEEEQEKQMENIEALELINQGLDDTRNSLLYDEDTLAVYAREQGYASPQERFARIVGLGINQNNLTNQGNVIAAAEPQYIPNQILRIISFCVGITIFFCAAMFDFLKHLHEK